MTTVFLAVLLTTIHDANGLDEKVLFEGLDDQSPHEQSRQCRSSATSKKFEGAGALLNDLWAVSMGTLKNNTDELVDAILNILTGNQSDGERLENSSTVNWPERRRKYSQEFDQ